MINFFTELKLFIERNEYAADLFFEYRGAKIPYDVAQEIYMDHFPLQEEYGACYEVIEEQRDFIRLLREENARLRGAEK